jgi:chemotaxis protein MotB
MMNIRYRNNTNAWPGFVDLFSNLVIILIFLLIMFLLLWTTTSVFNKTTGTRAVAELKQANAEQAQTIEEMESYKREANRLLLLARDELETMDLSTEDLITAYETKIIDMQAEIDDLMTKLNQATISHEQSATLEQERKLLQDQMSAQHAELTAQLEKLQAALDAAEEKSRNQEIEYVEMSTRLNKALADKVAELNDVSKYQSAFYKAIKLAMGDQTDITADGDRFIINSDILFPSGSYKLSAAGKQQLKTIAAVIRDMESKIPSDVDWIIRVDGHTDNKQVISGTRGYRNNTQLSLLRASAVVNELTNDGVSKLRLIPTGFGDMYPIAPGTDQASLQKNRRIELQLTNR